MHEKSEVIVELLLCIIVAYFAAVELLQCLTDG